MIDISINPLNVLNKRKLDYVPAHFVTTRIDGIFPGHLSKWVYENLNGRFAIAKQSKIVHNRSISVITVLAFEDPKEMTLTLLKCPLFKERK
jgi:hypothetical protein